MSIAEYGAPTESELQVLRIAQAMRSCGFVLDGCVNEAEARAAARRLVERKLGELFFNDAGEEVFRLNSAAAAYLKGLDNG